ncbi:UNVERIFIED_CONTAM: Glutathione S-transferase T1 [Sesamum radiatum]|uniref:Glutathione S-transferase T1 n=1 Tax=Sesamum radiatum TaxID=300843 RepID=A0AAW2JT25_SESRA
MELKLYVDRLSQPSRALLIFCKANGIEFEEVSIMLGKLQHRSPEYAEINPMKQVPAIVHGDFKLSESHSILIYLASAFPGVAEHWPIFLILLCFCQLDIILNTGIALAFGRPLDPKAAAEGEKLLSASLATIESLWLEGDGPFLLGNSQPSIADLALVCEIMQLEVAEEKDRDRILGKHKRVLKWIEDTKNATTPYFDEFHSLLPLAKEKLKELKAQASKQ